MKKQLIIATLLGATLLSAQTYQSTGKYTADSKNDACNAALNYAKQDALEQAGTVVLSKFSSAAKDVNGEFTKEVKDDLTTAALGTVQLKEKKEEVSTTENYQFTCKVTASFSIDQTEMKAKIDEMLQEKKKQSAVAGYFEAEGYSEEGQSRYKAFTAAKIIAQRNLLEVIKGSDLTSLTKVTDGMLESDKIGSLISGAVRGAQVVKKEYDPKFRSAMVVMRISKAKIAASLDEY